MNGEVEEFSLSNSPSTSTETESDTVIQPSDRTLTVGVATPLSEELCQLIESREPRVRLVRDQSLLAPMRPDQVSWR